MSLLTIGIWPPQHQAVVSGIYLFCVEDKETKKTQVGKFVIIKRTNSGGDR
jgi:hypothetical protein